MSDTTLIAQRVMIERLTAKGYDSNSIFNDLEKVFGSAAYPLRTICH